MPRCCASGALIPGTQATRACASSASRPECWLVATFWARPGCSAAGHSSCLALAAADPLVVTEGGQHPPHGLGLACLVWTFALCGRLRRAGDSLARRGRRRGRALRPSLVYTSCAFTSRSSPWPRPGRPGGRARSLVPGPPAALSLVPYARVLARMREWPTSFTTGSTGCLSSEESPGARDGSHPGCAAWTGVVAWGLRPRGRRCAGSRSNSAVVAALALPIQVAFLEARALAFPRYFLPAVALLALGSERALEERSARAADGGGARHPSRVGLARLVVGQVAAHQRRPVARALGGRAAGGPRRRFAWFLHPSFSATTRPGALDHDTGAARDR